MSYPIATLKSTILKSKSGYNVTLSIVRIVTSHHIDIIQITTARTTTTQRTYINFKYYFIIIAIIIVGSLFLEIGCFQCVKKLLQNQSIVVTQNCFTLTVGANFTEFGLLTLERVLLPPQLLVLRMVRADAGAIGSLLVRLS